MLLSVISQRTSLITGSLACKYCIILRGTTAFICGLVAILARQQTNYLGKLTWMR